MGTYFARDWQGARFELFGVHHLLALALIAVAGCSLLSLRGAPEAVRRRVRLGIVATMWCQETFWHLWNIAVGEWSMRTLLPLHLCSAMVWVCGVALLVRNRRLAEICYFLGLGGAIQALVTPNLDHYGFPHYRFFETLLAHALIVMAVIAMTFLEGFRPTWRGLWQALAALNAFAVVVFGINTAIGSNYLFINAKPEFATLLDALPPWPAYLPVLEIVAIGVFCLLYAPWALADRHARMRPNPGTDRFARRLSPPLQSPGSPARTVLVGRHNRTRKDTCDPHAPRRNIAHRGHRSERHSRRVGGQAPGSRRGRLH